MHKSTTSVAMCTYNGASYLKEQLDSIAMQDVLPEELVICDDGSADDTLSILSRFASEAAFPVRVEVNGARLGPAKNFERAISLCQGEIIILSDQDDRWMPHKIRRIVESFIQCPDAAYLFSDAYLKTDHRQGHEGTLWQELDFIDKAHLFTGSNQLQTLLKRNVVTGAALAFRRNIREIVLPIPVGWMHDYWIAILGSTYSYGIPIPEPLLEYRLHSQQACGLGKGFVHSARRSMVAGKEEWSARIESFGQLEGRISSVSSAKPPANDRLQMIRQKAMHLSARARIRSSGGLHRILGVMAEGWSGRYQRFSGWDSLMRDL